MSNIAHFLSTAVSDEKSLKGAVVTKEREVSQPIWSTHILCYWRSE